MEPLSISRGNRKQVQLHDSIEINGVIDGQTSQLPTLYWDQTMLHKESSLFLEGLRVKFLPIGEYVPQKETL